MYKRKEVVKLTGSERFKNTGTKAFSVQDFWQYGFSNLNSNVLRGALAEFLVESALKDTSDILLRNPWGDSDVDYHGTPIEVKCCAYIQDWDQSKLSAILWSGLKAKTLYWSSAVNSATKENESPEYKSNIYVLALFKHQETNTLDILDLDQWCFFVLSKDRLREISGDRSSISLARLEKFDIAPVGFAGLRSAIEESHHANA